MNFTFTWILDKFGLVPVVKPVKTARKTVAKKTVKKPIKKKA
tara:strand:+ start:271 stop:396 length:126 start_codon:yes stop_codon:yes gene_type:complete